MIVIPGMLVLFYVTCIVFMSNKQQLKNKRNNILFLEKYEKLYKLKKYQFVP
jgi:hypothetical protein